MAQASSPFRRNNSCRMIGESREDRDLVAGLRPTAGKLCDPASRRAHLGREILRDVEDLHEKEEAIAERAVSDRQGTGNCSFRVHARSLGLPVKARDFGMTPVLRADESTDGWSALASSILSAYAKICLLLLPACVPRIRRIERILANTARCEPTGRDGQPGRSGCGTRGGRDSRENSRRSRARNRLIVRWPNSFRPHLWQHRCGKTGD